MVLAAAAPNRPSTSSSSPVPAYMPGLDVLRGMAICMVLVCHGLDPSSGSIFRAYHSGLMLVVADVTAGGRFGVHLFFVLSGFLITGILVDSRETPDFYQNFYLRRALRILPAYIAVLVILLASRFISWRYVLVCLLYFCNMPGLFGAVPEYGPLWSLSVEEQFYLIWPLAVRKLSARGLALLSGLIVVLTPALRFVLLLGPAFLHDLEKKTWAVGDFFAAGALIALAVRSGRLRPLLARIGFCSLLGGLVLLGLSLLPGGHTSVPWQRFTLAIALEPWLLIFSGLVVFAYLRPAIARVRLAKPLLFLARISYGLYLCHEAIFTIVANHWPFPAIPNVGPYPQLIPKFLVGTAISIALATLSRNTLERFFLRLKPKHERSRQHGGSANVMT